MRACTCGFGACHCFLFYLAHLRIGAAVGLISLLQRNQNELEWDTLPGVSQGASHTGVGEIPSSELALGELPKKLRLGIGTLVSSVDPETGKMDISKMLGMMNALSNAAKDDQFMEVTDQFQKDCSAEAVKYREGALEQVRAFLEGNVAGEDDFLLRFSAVCQRQADLLREHSLKLKSISDSYMKRLPSSMGTGLTPMLDQAKGGMALPQGSAVVERAFANRLSEPHICGPAAEFFRNVSLLSDAQVQAQKGLNATFKLMPMMRDYFVAAHPEVASRVMYLVHNTIQTGYVETAALQEPTVLFNKNIGRLFYQRTHCTATSAGARRWRGRLAALAALVAAAGMSL